MKVIWKDIKSSLLTSFIGRPCQRCIKRSIGHLCHDEVKPSNHSTPVQTPVNKPELQSNLNYSLPNLTQANGNALKTITTTTTNSNFSFFFKKKKSSWIEQ